MAVMIIIKNYTIILMYVECRGDYARATAWTIFFIFSPEGSTPLKATYVHYARHSPEVLISLLLLTFFHFLFKTRSNIKYYGCSKPTQADDRVRPSRFRPQAKPNKYFKSFFVTLSFSQSFFDVFIICAR